MKKRITAFLLVLILTVSSGIHGAYAAELQPEEMSRVILAVKNKLEIGEEFSDFDYSYYQSGDGVTWDFYWRTEDYSKYISATSDNDGRISYTYFSYDTSNQGMPVYTKEELLPTVLKYAERIFPEMEGHYRFTGASYRSYQKSYTYNFVRVENEIDLPDNTLSLTVSSIDGSLFNAQANWNYDVVIPAADVKLSKAEAAALVGEHVNMELRYYLTYGSEGDKVFLAYTPSASYMAVDAGTGEVFDTRSYWRSAAGGSNEMSKSAVTAEADTAGGFVAVLTPAELGEIEKVKDIISDEEAIAIVKDNPYLQIDPSINTITASLRTSSTSYTWSIQMRDATPVDWSKDDTYRASASATVDAMTGELISFSASNKSYYYMTDEEIESLRVKYDEEQCRKIFADFATGVNKEKFESTRFNGSYNTYTINYDYDTRTYSYGGYGLSYVRVNEDVPLESNYIQGSVNAVTGKVFDYYTNWTDGIEFPSPATAISEREAFESYISYDGFDLVYEIVTTVVDSDDPYETKTEASVRLVYRTQISPNYVDAFTGKQLSYNGTEYVRAAKEFAYTDIQGTKYERAIRLLADIGVGFETVTFDPDGDITLDDFQKLIDMTGYFYVQPDDKMIGSGPSTRLRVAVGVVKALGYGELAKLPIFKTGYDDEDSIDDCNLGYAALAKGFEIMGAKTDNKFKPYDSVTRGEAADIILRMIASIK